MISGARDAVARAVEIARARGAKRAVLLPVSAPFHCPLMQPAAEEMTEALAGISLTAPRVPLIANVTASAVTAPDEIRALLVAQVCGTVRWRESVLHMRERGVETLVELGAGKVLSGLVRRIDRTVTGSSVATPAGVEALLGTL